MGKKQREQILFSCLGSSDPVRGLHDGAMLHIARHYRPAKIQWYITKEMRLADERDHRYSLSMAYLTQQCPGYDPEILPPIYDETEDASDFDGFYESFSKALRDLSRSEPEAEILLNLSSGTPQMKMTLALLAQNLQYRIRVVQVKNFERRSGSADRTTSRSYELEMELELNEDAQPGAENRCSEPKLLGLQREKQRAQVAELLNRYDYSALLAMNLPEPVLPLIRHLALRADYDLREAIAAGKSCSGWELFPALNKKEPSYREYQKLSEYLLTLKLMEKTQRYTDLVIRLNPFVIRLQKAWLERKNVDLSTLGQEGWTGELYIKRDMVAAANPALLQELDRRFAPKVFRDSFLNIALCNCLIGFFSEGHPEDQAAADFFRRLETLNERARNDSAHTLTNVRDSEILNILGMDSAELISRLISLMKQIYPRHYDGKLFSIYDTLNSEILNLL